MINHKLNCVKLKVIFILSAFGLLWYCNKVASRDPQYLSEESNDYIRPLYMITPTYPRPTQVPDLTRLAQTLMHIRGLTWLVIEDSQKVTQAVEKLLERTGLPYVHLIAPIPDEYIHLENPPKGVSNRIRGLEWIRANATTGVFYFADDDNSYDIRIFEEMRDTRRVSMWPVGLLDGGIGTPVIKEGKIVGFHGWIGGRKYAVDMAGFARPDATMPFISCQEEEGFLESLEPLNLEDIELKASNCTEVLVWHTRTKKFGPDVAPNLEAYNNTNIIKLYQKE